MLKSIDSSLHAGLRVEAQKIPRRRVHHCLHASPDDPVQRLVVDMEPGTYIRPHRHRMSPKWELFFCLAGSGFEEVGTLLVEVKPGPYAVLPEEDFAPWAPAEGEAAAAEFEAALHELPVGRAVTL
ncbi:MAG: hypothetical protein CVU68_05270 [Deltaproteobacteria bacterium HGW-Deltaproteobacteria-3]|nr:MAG: hypothetical protein CVU68_05270 [Deltaproteobacteria bacterium HGW-Deltaproteobacteria-3]